jgi:hypothetical protein
LAAVTARQTTNGRVVLNNEYDPANLFRLNQNVRPVQPIMSDRRAVGSTDVIIGITGQS